MGRPDVRGQDRGASKIPRTRAQRSLGERKKPPPITTRPGSTTMATLTIRDRELAQDVVEQRGRFVVVRGLLAELLHADRGTEGACARAGTALRPAAPPGGQGRPRPGYLPRRRPTRRARGGGSRSPRRRPSPWRNITAGDDPGGDARPQVHVEAISDAPKLSPGHLGHRGRLDVVHDGNGEVREAVPHQGRDPPVWTTLACLRSAPRPRRSGPWSTRPGPCTGHVPACSWRTACARSRARRMTWSAPSWGWVLTTFLPQAPPAASTTAAASLVPPMSRASTALGAGGSTSPAPIESTIERASPRGWLGRSPSARRWRWRPAAPGPARPGGRPQGWAVRAWRRWPGCRCRGPRAAGRGTRRGCGPRAG